MIFSNSIRRKDNNGALYLFGGEANNSYSANITLYGGERTNSDESGNFSLVAANITNRVSLHGKTNGELIWNNNDLAGSAITNKLIAYPGYICYVNGLILQWGIISVTTGTSLYIVLPIKYPSGYSILVTKHGLDNAICQISADAGGSLAGFSFMYSSRPSGGYFYGSWVTLGF